MTGRGGKASRDKGNAGEREMVNLLREHFRDLAPELDVKRMLSQARDSGPDIEMNWPDGSQWFVEVKRWHHHPSRRQIDKWYATIVRWLTETFEGERADAFVMVAYRVDKATWRVVYTHPDGIIVDADFLDWVKLIRLGIRAHRRQQASAARQTQLEVDGDET